MFSSLFPKVIRNLDIANDIWQKWFITDECEKVFPAVYLKRITPFQKVLITQVFRPDRLQSELSNFV